MKKIFTFVMLSIVSLTTAAQVTVLGSGFFDNWSLSLVGGGMTPLKHSAFFGGMRPTYGLELTKKLTPVVSMAVQGTLAHHLTSSTNVVDGSNVVLLGKFNLTNFVVGYTGRPRPFELEALAGAGWGHYYNNDAVGSDDNFMSTQFGLNFNFNLGDQRAWTVSLRPSLVYNMEGGQPHPTFNANQAALQLMAGVTYHFKNQNNGCHYFTIQRAYDPTEVDALNAKINDMRQFIANRDADMAELVRVNESLIVALDEARTLTRMVEHQPEHSCELLETVITFRQGKSGMDKSQMPNVERIAIYMKNHPESRVDIKGYASPEGNAEANQKLASKRAEAVKQMLVKKYRIDAQRIDAKGQGVGNLFSEPDWNRVSIATIVTRSK